MRRRRFIAIIAGIAVLPLAAHAQQAAPSTAQASSTHISGCVVNSAGFPQRLDGPRWNGWEADLGNSRFQLNRDGRVEARPSAIVAAEMGVRIFG